ncbi:glycosyltransferase [Halobacteriaceae archaeon GCM10025711]
MAAAIGAEFVPAAQGGAVERVLAGTAHWTDSRPLLLEGGVPLLEGAVANLVNRAGPVVLLAADETQYDIHHPLPYYTSLERLVHRLSHRFVDGAVAVSEHVAADLRRLIDGPVRVAHPFILQERFERLGAISPALDDRRLLAVGEHRPAMAYDRLVSAVERAETDVTLDLVGKGTENAPGGDAVRRHGFVSEEAFVDRFAAASGFAFVGLAGAFPVTTLEAMRAGVPPIVSDRIGTAPLVADVEPRLVTEPDPDCIAATLDWYFDPDTDRFALSEAARERSEAFSEERLLPVFEDAFASVLEALR